VEKENKLSSNDIVLGMAGFQAFSKKAVEIVSKFHGATPETTFQKEVAWVEADGCLMFNFLNANGELLDSLRISPLDFKLKSA